MSYGYDRWSTASYPYRRRRRRRPGCLLLVARVVVFCVVVGVVGSIAQQWFSGQASEGRSGGGLFPGQSDFPDNPTGSDNAGKAGEPGIDRSPGDGKSGRPSNLSSAIAVMTSNPGERLVSGSLSITCLVPHETADDDVITDRDP